MVPDIAEMRLHQHTFKKNRKSKYGKCDSVSYYRNGLKFSRTSALSLENDITQRVCSSTCNITRSFRMLIVFPVWVHAAYC